MILTNMYSNLRVELQDLVAPYNYTDDELGRAVDKTVSLMSRLIPRKAIVETTLVRSITGEVLAIASSTGTLAYKPIEVGTLTISGKVLDTDYRVNYLTGVVTEIGSGLTDGNYTVSYDLDSNILDLTPILPDYIKIDRVEYPAGSSPPSIPTFDTFGNFLSLRSGSFTGNEHLRIIYQGRWTTPTQTTEGNYPSHLNDAVIIGSTGQALIYKAEKYTKLAADALSVITAPTAYTFVKPTSPSLPSAPTAPTPPTPSYTAVETSLTAVGTEITAAKVHITDGIAKVNTATRGADVAANYGKYADTVMGASNTRVNEAIARLRQIEEALTLYSSDVTAYGSAVNAYANNISGLMGKYNGENDSESAGIANFSAQVNKYNVQVNEQQMKATNFLEIAGRYLASGQSKINEFLIMLGLKPELNYQKASSEQRG